MNENEFIAALTALKDSAKDQGGVLTWEEIEEVFEAIKLPLNDERKALIEDYLKNNHIGIGEAVDPDAYLSESERNYLEEYLSEIKELADISDGEKRAVMIAALAGEADAKNRLMEIMLPSVADIAKLYTGFGVDIADLIGEGNVALTMAMEMFDCVEGPDDLESFIATQAMNAMEEFIKDNTDVKKSDDKMLAKINKIADKAKELSEDLGREVSPQELAEETGLSLKSIMDAMLITGDKIEGISKGQTS